MDRKLSLICLVLFMTAPLNSEEIGEDSTSGEQTQTLYKFKGSWSSDYGLKSFSHKEGKSELLVDIKGQNSTDYLRIVLFDGPYESDPYISFFIKEADVEEDSVIFHNDKVRIIKGSTQSSQESSISGRIDFGVEHLNVSASINITDYVFSFEGTLLTTDMERKPAIIYSFIYSCIAVMVIYAYIRQTNECMTSDSKAKKNSLLTWTMCAIIDSFLCVWHLQLAFKSLANFDYYMLDCCWSFVCAIVVKGKLMMSVWKAQHPEVEAFGSFMLRRLTAQFQNKVFITIMCTLVVVIVLDFMYLVSVVVLHSFFIPQIVKNAREGYRHAINFNSVLTLSAARIIFILYFFGCEKNFLFWEPHVNYSFWLSLFIVAQAMVLYIQNTKIGPRFFIPRSMRPQMYSYYRTLAEERERETDDCPICMTALNLQGQKNLDVVNTHRTLHTPCGHTFHEDCLVNWTAVKMECPTCRCSLPPIEE